MPPPTDACQCHGLLRVRTPSAQLPRDCPHTACRLLFGLRGALAHALPHRQGLWPLRRQSAQQRAHRKSGSAWLATAWLLDGDWATERLSRTAGAGARKDKPEEDPRGRPNTEQLATESL